jgi:hypothetical protein
MYYASQYTMKTIFHPSILAVLFVLLCTLIFKDFFTWCYQTICSLQILLNNFIINHVKKEILVNLTKIYIALSDIFQQWKIVFIVYLSQSRTRISKVKFCGLFNVQRCLFVSFYIGVNVVLHCLNFLFIILLF